MIVSDLEAGVELAGLTGQPGSVGKAIWYRKAGPTTVPIEDE
jgi:hypothetical protein